MTEKGIRSEIYLSINRNLRGNNKYMKDYDKNKESSYLRYWDLDNLCGYEMSQKLLLYDLIWVEDISDLMKAL